MRKLISYAVIALTCVAFLNTSTLLGQEWSKEQKEVWKVVKTGWESWKTGDTEGAFATIHDKYLGWNNDDPLPISKAKWKSMYEIYKEFSTIEFYNLDAARILVEGNNAVAYYYFEFYSTFTKGDKTKEQHLEGKNVEFYIREGGNWMLLGDMTVFDDDDD